MVSDTKYHNGVVDSSILCLEGFIILRKLTTTDNPSAMRGNPSADNELAVGFLDH